MDNRETELQQLKGIFQGHPEAIQLSEDKLKVAYGLFVGVFIPEVRDILNLVSSIGNESPRFNSWRTQLTQDLSINFMKSKSPDEADRIQITDGGFTNVLFQLNGNVVTVEDEMIQERVVLDSAGSLVQSIPSSRRSPAGNALGWVGKITEKMTEVKKNLENTSK